MANITITLVNSVADPIPNYIFYIWASTSSLPLDPQHAIEISTGADGYISHFTSSAIWVAPKPDLHWDAPFLTDGSHSTAPKWYQGNVSAGSDWKADASVKPNKPEITAGLVDVSGNKFIRITHTNDITKYENDTIVYYNTSNNFFTATSISELYGSAPVVWRNTTKDPATQINITTVDFSNLAILEDQKYWFWMETVNFAGESLVSEFVTATLLSGNYTLTIHGAVGGTITGPNCADKISGETCISNPSPTYGFAISISMVADTGYLVGDVLISPAIPYNLTVVDSQHHNLTFVNSSNLVVDVTPTFVSVPCQLNLSIDKESYTNAKGKIKLNTPDLGDTYSTTSKFLSIPNPNVNSPITISADPNYNYQVKEWVIDGTEVVPTTSSSVFTSADGTSTISVDISGDTNKTVAVRFEVLVGTFYTLTIEESGLGGTSPSSGEYIAGQVIAINPLPAPGWVFTGWAYPSSSNFLLDGNTLFVTMANDPMSGITAIFEEAVISDVTSVRNQTATVFYCSSEIYKDNVVSFNFVNSSEDPSTDDNYHFRVNFYADISKDKLVYSAFSLADNKRWFLNDGSFSQLSSSGLNVGLSETVSVVYDPEILPQQITESQKPQLLNNNTVTYEKPLVCGIKYYVEVQAYETSSNVLTNVVTIPLILDCDRVDSYYWNYNKDKNNWLCSGQGKVDLQVCGGFGQSINSSIASNLFGIFKIVWQGRKIISEENINNIYSAIWDSSKDILYSSGQGLYDVLEITGANYPVVMADPALNFYITGTIRNNIKYKSCSLGICDDTTSGGTSTVTSSFPTFCYPGDTSFLSSSYDEIKMRIYEEDISGSLVVNDEKVVPVVSKKSIRLDVDGIVGAYAVRIRNMEDKKWGEWINIDNKLFEGGVDDDLGYDAYRIDNSRFLVQWGIEKNNGLRRICCQVLTLYGISNTFCIELLANFEVPQHVFKFYTKNTRLSGFSTDNPQGDEFPPYNGQYVLSLDADGIIINPDGGATVYFDAVFSDSVYKDEINLIKYDLTDVKFNVVQQGVNDLRNQAFDVVTKDKFSGQFDIYRNDGIFNKDGAAFIEILFPDTTVSESCGSDDRDNYNLVNSDLEEISNINLLPEEVYKKYQSDKLSKDLDINKFKQNYDKDDTNFKFGNPGYYKE